MKVAPYVRVSSDKQDVELSVSAQLRSLRDYAFQNDYEIVREFIDEAETGRTANRPVFLEMVASAKQKPPPFEAVLVWKFSRFARNREDSSINHYCVGMELRSSPSTSPWKTVPLDDLWKGLSSPWTSFTPRI